MQQTLEIVPGCSIGPFRLGMTLQQIEEVLRLLAAETLTLEDLGIVAFFEGAEHCQQIGVRVWNNDNTILLHNQVVNNIRNEDAIRLFELFAGPVSHSYGGFSALQTGIEAVRWEDSDSWIDSIFVKAIDTPAGTQVASTD